MTAKCGLLEVVGKFVQYNSVAIIRLLLLCLVILKMIAVLNGQVGMHSIRPSMDKNSDQAKEAIS